MRKIKTKVLRIILTTALSATLIISIASSIVILSLKENTFDSLETLYNEATDHSTVALRTQKKNELFALAENKGAIADASLKLILNQTRLVAMATEDIFSNQSRYLPSDIDYATLPLETFDFSCNYPSDLLNEFSVHLRAPRALLNPDSISEEKGVVTKAQLDRSLLTKEQIKELYLAQYLEGALGGIRNFDNGDGTYSGIGATYFCFDSSGIDVLADTLTNSMVEYDAREKTWYKEAKKLKKGEVYWTKPVQDGSGRGIALICAMPVYVGDKFIGVAGSGGLIDNIRELVQSTTIGESGYAFLVNVEDSTHINLITSANKKTNSEIEHYKDNLLDTTNSELFSILKKIASGTSDVDEITLDEERVFIAYQPITQTSWVMVTVIGMNDKVIVEPINSLRANIDEIRQQSISDFNFKIILLIIIFVVFIIIIAILIIFLSYKFSDNLTKPILKLNKSMGEIADGNLDLKITIDTGDEIEDLGNSANTMTRKLKEYIKNIQSITAEKERIGAELDVATKIQASMLPCIFPAFPDRVEFDIYASMLPAKEVGGDFYDFFLINDTNLAVVIADVSGKGVPAALFMVIAKTLIKNNAQYGKSPKEIFETVNNQLCEGNEANMFVTAFMGILEISTGKFTYVNAGHNPPVIKKAEDNYEWLITKPGFVLAGMEDMRYRQDEIVLEQGDTLYMYTDGVTEATNAENELFTDPRLLAVLNKHKDDNLSELLHCVKNEIDLFVKDAPQFDDITMLALKIN